MVRRFLVLDAHNRGHHVHIQLLDQIWALLGIYFAESSFDVSDRKSCHVKVYHLAVLFPGRHNNEVLRQMMEVRGPFSRKLLKKASPGLRSQHFDEEGMFLARELDKGSQVESVRALPPPTGPSRQLGEMLCSPKIMARMPSQTRQQVELLRVFLEQALVLDPAKRARPVQALQLFKGRGSGGKK